MTIERKTGTQTLTAPAPEGSQELSASLPRVRMRQHEACSKGPDPTESSWLLTCDPLDSDAEWLPRTAQFQLEPKGRYRKPDLDAESSGSEDGTSYSLEILL